MLTSISRAAGSAALFTSTFAILALGCGSDATPTDPDGASTTPRPSSSSSPSPSPSTSPNPSAGPSPSPDLLGLWQVTGKDSRGTYAGQVELSQTAITRVIRYDSATVEDGRALHWVWQGTASGDANKLTITVPLQRADFIVKRGNLTRTAADGPITVTGEATTGSAPNTLSASFKGADIDASETWSSHTASGPKPIFAIDRVITPSHDPPSASTKSTLFGAYKGFQSLPPVQPYTARPEFQAAVHGTIVDKTDFDFYQANPNAIRVVNKVVDDISLAETWRRANAYRYTLASKADKFQHDMQTRFIDPSVGMMFDGGPPSGPFQPTGDGSLWTGVYIASQAYRYQVTGDASALANIELSLDAMLKLQEITGDWSHFARTLRKADPNVPPTGGWHAGTGTYANLEWLEGGNNDMLKGILYAYVIGYETLCDPSTAGHESLCERIRTNSKHLADDVATSQGFNQFTSAWLAAYVNDSTSYRIKAEGLWLAAKVEITQNPQFYSQGTADWSGTHLGFVSSTIEALLARHINLGGEAQDVLKGAIDQDHANLERLRLPYWHIIHATFGSGAKTSPFIDDTRWRMREFPFPKVSYDSDRRINPEFCMSPYPSVPWKNDFMNYPQTDRTHALNEAPLFETSTDVFQWKSYGRYTGSGNYETPGADYLHLYWYARRSGLLSATE